MSYNEFSYFYDEFNDDANYDKLFEFINNTFKKYNINNSIIADLGCGTGEISLRLSEVGHDVIAIDLSEEMLNVLYDKISSSENTSKILVLNQDITQLDLYGTINGAVSTFDTFNHLTIEQLENAIKSVSFFMEKNSVFIFDMNTEFKHTNILKNNTYKLETDDAICVWENKLNEEEKNTLISINISYTDENENYNYFEQFYEYYYSKKFITKLCSKYGLEVKEVYDGESFENLTTTSQRMIFVCVKQYTQNDKD